MKKLLILLGLLTLTACTAPAKLEEEPRVDMGNFRLGHNIVVVEDPEQGPFSRNATNEELKAALEGAISDRFGPFEGDNFYHIGIKLDLYALALPGVPIVFTPQSVFVITVNIWDDSTQERLNEEGGKAFTVFEGVSKESVISSGLMQNKARQMEILSANAAKMIQDWLLENPDWFGIELLEDDLSGEAIETGSGDDPTTGEIDTTVLDAASES